MKKLLFLSAFVLAGCSSAAVTGPSSPTPSTAAPDSFLVTFTTSKGDFIAKAHRNWSPLAVDRFYALTKGDVWSDARIFRVVPGFVAQWGLTGDSARDNLWRNNPVPDEPVKVPNLRGRMSFARGGPQTRTLQVFINLTDNSSQLDNAVIGGIAGYPPFAEITTGMDIVDKLEGKYADQPTGLQPQISANGWPWLDARFPGLDRIIRTRVTKEWPH